MKLQCSIQIHFFQDLPGERGKGRLQHFRRWFEDALLPEPTPRILRAVYEENDGENGPGALAVQGDRDGGLRLRQGCPARCSGGLREAEREQTWRHHPTLGFCEEYGTIFISSYTNLHIIVFFFFFCCLILCYLLYRTVKRSFKMNYVV